MSECLLTIMEILTERQHEIIEAAGVLLTKKGINGLTIKNLAKEMHFTESAVYRHFQSKEEIILSLLNYLNTEMELICKNASELQSNVMDRFISLFEQLMLFFSKNKHFVVVVFSDGLMEESKAINADLLGSYSIDFTVAGT